MDPFLKSKMVNFHHDKNIGNYKMLIYVDNLTVAHGFKNLKFVTCQEYIILLLRKNCVICLNFLNSFTRCHYLII